MGLSGFGDNDTSDERIKEGELGQDISLVVRVRGAVNSMRQGEDLSSGGLNGKISL